MEMNRRHALALGGAGVIASLVSPSLPVMAHEHAPATTASGVDPIAFLDSELQPMAQAMFSPEGTNFTVENLAAIRAGSAATAQPPSPDVPVEELRIPGLPGQPEVLAFLVNGGQPGARPGIVHTHGGGHILGAARNELADLQQLATALDCMVLTVDYRLAPETRYTGSVADNYAALKWFHDSAATIGLDQQRIAVMGESAGGTHAALLAIEARNRGEIPVCFQCLVYPMLDDRTGSTVPVPDHIGRILWDAKANRFGWTQFLGVEAGSDAVPVAGVPARTSSLAGLPPAWIGTGGADLFMAEDMVYAQRLAEAGVAAELLVAPRAFHAFDKLVPQAQVSQRFTAAKVDALRRAFAAG